MADEERPPTPEEIQILRSLIGELDNEEQGKSSYFLTPRFFKVSLGLRSNALVFLKVVFII